MTRRNIFWGIISGSAFLFCCFVLLGTTSRSAGLDKDEEKEGHEDIQKREQWFTRPRQQGLKGRNPAELFFQARQKVKTMPKAIGPSRSTLAHANASPALVTANFTFGSWNAAGPQGLQGSTVYSGRGTAIAVDLKNDPSGNTVYYGAASGGVWKSTNALSNAATFAPISDQTESLVVGAIALDSSSNPANVYVGTGEANGGINDTYYGIGFLKSTDGGNTWNPPVTTATGPNGTVSLFGLSFSKIIVDTTNSQDIVASTTEGSFSAAIRPGSLQPLSVSPGVFYSSDGGNTWTQSSSLAGATVNDMVYDTTRNTYFAAVYGNGIYASTDKGHTWTAVTFPLTYNAGAFFNRASLATRNGILYALITIGGALSQPTPQDTGLVQSVDGGNTWTPIAVPPGGGDVLGGQLEYDLCMLAPPGSNDLIIGGVVLFMTNNVNGMSTSWTDVTPIHGDQHAFGLFSNTGYYIANDGGLYYTTNLGKPLNELNDTLNTIQFYSVSPDLKTAGLLIGGSQDNGNDVNSGSGLSWKEAFGGDGFYTLADPQNQGIYYGNTTFGDVERYDSSIQKAVTILNPIVGGVPPIEMVPQAPGSMIAGGTQVMMGPVNPPSPGAGWNAISPTFSNPINFLAPASSDVNTIYLTEGQAIHKTTNATSASPTWSSINPAGLSLPLGHIAVNPGDPNTVYVVVEGFYEGQKIYKSTDGGTTWINISGTLPNIPVNWITIDPQNPGSIYIAADVGVFLATDGGTVGEGWQTVGTALPNAPILQVKISPVTRQLVASTFGRGAWTLDIGGVLNANRPPTPTPTFVCVPTGAVWNPITPAAQFESRTWFGSAVFNNQMWVIGGHTGSGSITPRDNNDVWYSGNGKDWNQAGLPPFAAREQFGLLAFDPGDGLGQRLWVVGGFNALSNPVSLYNDVWSSYDGQNWALASTHANFPARAGFGSAVFNNQMWVIGGGGYDDVWSSFDGIHWLQEANNVGFLPHGVVAAGVLNNQLFVMGGGSSSTDPNRVWSSPDGVNWNLVTANTGFTPRNNFAGLSFGGKLWIIGGSQGTARFNDVWSSTDGKTWTPAPGVPPFPARSNGGDLVFQNQLWVIGGDSSVLLNDVWSTSCTQGPPTPTPSFTPVCTAPVTAGYAGIGSVTGHVDNARMYANAVTLSGPMNVESLSLYIGDVTYSGSTPPHEFILSIYADNGSGYPGALIAQSGFQQATSNSWNTAAFPWTSLSAGVYWAAVQVDDGDGGMATAVNENAGSGNLAYVSSGVVFGSAPLTYPAGTIVASQQVSLYMTGCSSSAIGGSQVGAGLVGNVINQIGNIIGIRFNLTNNQSTQLDLSGIEVRYWFDSNCQSTPDIRAWIQGREVGDTGRRDNGRGGLILTSSGALAPGSSIQYLSFKFNGGTLPAGSKITIGSVANFAQNVLSNCGLFAVTTGSQLTVYQDGTLILGQVPLLGATATPTATPTPTCSTVSAGKAVAGKDVYPDGFNTVLGSVFTLPAGIVVSLSVNIETNFGNGQVQLGIYKDNQGTPGNLLAQSQPENYSGLKGNQQWITAPVPSTLLTAGKYWLVVTASGSPWVTGDPGTPNSGVISPFAPPIGNLPGTFPANELNTIVYSIYANECGASMTTPTETLTVSATATPTISPTVRGFATPTPTCPFASSAFFNCGPTATPTQGLLSAAVIKGPGILASLFNLTPTPTPTPVVTIPVADSDPLVLSVVTVPHVAHGGKPVKLLLTLARTANVQWTIYSSIGEKMYQSTTQGQTGLNTLTWQARSQTNQAVASGIYSYVIETDEGLSQTFSKGKIFVWL